jgi:hypothetical protein
MGKDEVSGVRTERQSPGHHKQNEADQIMETKEQREQRLESARIGVVITREMAKLIRRNANKAPAVSDKIRRLPI